jgi:hypothetical protein
MLRFELEDFFDRHQHSDALPWEAKSLRDSGALTNIAASTLAYSDVNRRLLPGELVESAVVNIATKPDRFPKTI